MIPFPVASDGGGCGTHAEYDRIDPETV